MEHFHSRFSFSRKSISKIGEIRLRLTTTSTTCHVTPPTLIVSVQASGYEEIDSTVIFRILRRCNLTRKKGEEKIERHWKCYWNRVEVRSS